MHKREDGTSLSGNTKEMCAMPQGATVLLWLLIPVIATFGAWYILRHRDRINPNSNIDAGVTEMQKFRASMANANPHLDSTHSAQVQNTAGSQTAADETSTPPTH
jgi:hypothetical protein